VARQTLESRFICSIYPSAPPPIKKYVGISPNENSPRCTRYMLPAVPKNGKPQWDHDVKEEPDLAPVAIGPGWATVEVSDSFENVEDILASTRRKRKFNSRLIPCERMVANLLQEWAGNMVGVPAGIGPGIMEIANPTPTTNELAHMHHIQNAFFEHMFAEGERLSANRQMKEITRPMIDAAEWFDRKTSWATTTFIKMVPCPHCKQDIPPDATVCHICHRAVEEKAVAAAASANVEQELDDLRKAVAKLLAQQNAEPTAPAQPQKPLAPKPLPERSLREQP
jgi:hypothetical protein